MAAPALSRCRRRAALGGLALAVVLASPAAEAADWSLDGALSQRFDVDTNFGLDPNEDEDASFGTRTGLGLSLGAQTDRTNWQLGTGFSYTYRTDRDNDDSINGIRPNFNGRVTHARPLYSLNSGFRFRQRSTAETRFDPFFDDPDEDFDDDDFVDDGRVVERDVIQTNFTYNAGGSFRLSPQDSLNVSGSVSLLRYDEDLPNREPANSYRASVGWSRSLTPVSSGGVSASVLHFTSDNQVTPESNRSTTASFALNYSVQPTPRHGFNASAGASYTDQTEDFLFGPFLIRQEDTSVGFNGGAGFSYTGARESIGVSISQSVRPTDFGEVRNVTSVSANYSRPLTRNLDFGVRATLSRQNSTGFDEDDEQSLRAGVGANLGYRITEDLSLGLSYSFRWANEDDDVDDGVAISNRVALTLRQSFSIFP